METWVMSLLSLLEHRLFVQMEVTQIEDEPVT